MEYLSTLSNVVNVTCEFCCFVCDYTLAPMSVIEHDTIGKLSQFTDVPMDVQAHVASFMDAQTFDGFSVVNKASYAIAKNYMEFAYGRVKHMDSFLALPLADVLRYKWLGKAVHDVIVAHIKAIHEMECDEFMQTVHPLLMKNERLARYIMSSRCMLSESLTNLQKQICQLELV